MSVSILIIFSNDREGDVLQSGRVAHGHHDSHRSAPAKPGTNTKSCIALGTSSSDDVSQMTLGPDHEDAPATICHHRKDSYRLLVTI